MLDVNVPSGEGRAERRPGTPQGGTSTNISVVFALITTVIVVAVSVIFFLIHSAQKARLVGLTREAEDLQKQLSTGELADLDKKSQAVSRQIKVLEQTLGNRTVFSKVLEELNNSTLKNVRYKSFAIDEKGTATLTGETESYSDIAKLARTFETSDTFTAVEIQSANLQEDQKGKKAANFALTMKLNLGKAKETK